MREKPKCFIECLIPSTVCNLKCSYCYVIQRHGNTQEVPELPYPVDRIKQALTKERLGGGCYFSVCAAGETLAPKYTLQIVRALLENGHHVNVTTNGTLSNRFRELCDWTPDILSRLHFAFSFHYLELLRLNKLDVFFDNICLVKSLGCSFIVQLNLCDEYLPHIEEIKSLCMVRVGAWPQIAATRREVALDSKVLFETELTDEEYVARGREFDSPLFDFTVKNFNVKMREFCYAGAWSFQLDLLSGVLRPCYHSRRSQNLYEDPESPIRRRPVGRSCGSLFCMNSSHFMSLGIIPSVETPTYAALRDRPGAGWYTPGMREFLDGKLTESNVESGSAAKFIATALGRMENAYSKARGMAVRLVRKIGKKL